MKKKHFFARLGFALIVVLISLSSRSTIALATSPIQPPNLIGGCVSEGDANHLYFTIKCDYSTHIQNGSNVFIWVLWSGGYLGPLSPYYLSTNSTGGYDYFYDASSLSHLNLPPDECYTIYATTQPVQPSATQPSSSIEVCPCPEMEDINLIPVCNADFYYNTNSLAPSSYYFSSGANTLPPLIPAANPFTWSYHWDFGDGTTSTTPSPLHTYAATGSYTVCLTAKILQNGVEVSSCVYCTDICVNQITGMLPGPDGLRTTAKEGLKLRLTPNPASNTLNASINLTRTRKTEVIILDAMGNTRFRTNVSFTQDKRSIDIDTRDLPVGAYTLYIKSAEGVVSSHFIINR